MGYLRGAGNGGSVAPRIRDANANEPPHLYSNPETHKADQAVAPDPALAPADMTAIQRCAKRVLKGEKLLRWVLAEVDLSGHMELAAAIEDYLGQI
jgi:hypothetical protein